MDGFLMLVNQSKVIWGLSMLLLQFGARYVLGDLGKMHEALLSHEITKKIVVMSMFFVATRDIVVSFVLTIAYIVIIDGILHEERKFSLVPRHLKTNPSLSTKVTVQDYEKAKYVAKLYEQQNKKEDNESKPDEKHLSYLNYVSKIALVK